ncbi:MAG: NAD-dependent protein deacylase [Bacilli bacterium]|nr:NAD-dependent protein deacylase [Bacilli bacterium]
MDKYQTLKEILDGATQIMVFTGAGISVPSGIPDFRSADGIYNQKTKLNYPPEEIISHTFFYNHTKEFFEFYKDKMVYENAEPNEAHKFIAALEKKGKNVIVATQNIDGLHQKAGSSTVYELHGSVHRNYCDKCNRSFGLRYVMTHNPIPYCDRCHGIVKPDVVLYEEELNSYTIERTISAMMTSDVLLVIGTSLRVYPAAGFIRYFKGRYIVLINKEQTSYDNMCDLVFNEDVVQVFKKIK